MCACRRRAATAALAVLCAALTHAYHKTTIRRLVDAERYIAHLRAHSGSGVRGVARRVARSISRAHDDPSEGAAEWRDEDPDPRTRAQGRLGGWSVSLVSTWGPPDPLDVARAGGEQHVRYSDGSGVVIPPWDLRASEDIKRAGYPEDPKDDAAADVADGAVGAGAFGSAGGAGSAEPAVVAVAAAEGVDMSAMEGEGTAEPPRRTPAGEDGVAGGVGAPSAMLALSGAESREEGVVVAPPPVPTERQLSASQSSTASVGHAIVADPFGD